MVVHSVSSILLDEPLAIPIPVRRCPSYSTATTPSLQSVLEQRKYGLRESLSLSSHSQDSCSLSSGCSILTAATEECDTHPLECEENSYMEDIDEDFFTMAPMETVSPVKSKVLIAKPSFVSNLSRSIKSLTDSQNELLFELQPRLTDDKLPATCTHPEQSQELETYRVTSQPSPCAQLTVHRAREPRINSKFLRLYAHESAARKSHSLPEISQEEEERFLHDPAIFRGSHREFALLVRQRLWQCVVLPPREDALCDHTPEYVRVDGGLATSRPRGKPWATLEDELGCEFSPRGVLGKGTQFVVEGWCNARWLDN